MSLTLGAATFSDKNVGTGKTVTLAGAVLDGAAKGNYTLSAVATTKANITALAITGSFAVSDKVYDGNTAATTTSQTPNGVLGTDVVSLTGGTATFDTKDVAANKTVTAMGMSVSFP